MFRVYSIKEKRWIKEAFMFQDGSIFRLVKKFPLSKKIQHIPNEDCVVHMWIHLYDKSNTKIYEGDICKIKEDVYGVVCYAEEIGGFCILDDDNGEYYSLDCKTSTNCEVVGNCIDGFYGKTVLCK